MASKKPAVAGEGTKFKKLETKLEAQGKKPAAAKAIAAAIGRKKYGKSDMADASAAGRKGKVHQMKKGGK